MDETEARAIAADWHGGQTSALYVFASTSHISNNLEWEIRQELKMPHLSGKGELRALLAYVGEQKLKIIDEALSKTITLTVEEAEFVYHALITYSVKNHTTILQNKIIDDVLEKISHG